MDLAPDFNEFLRSLTANGVEFVVVGAYAVAFHGVPRFTGDIDILVRPTADNGRRLIAAVREFGFPTDLLDADEIAAGAKIVQMGVEPVQIHVMSRVSGVSWDEAWAGRAEARIDDLHIPFIGRRELIRNKRAAGRLKDLADIEALTPPGATDPEKA